MNPTAARFAAYRHAHPPTALSLSKGTLAYTATVAMFDLQESLRSAASVVVELWEYPPHARDGRTEHYLTQPVEAARKVTLPVADIRRKQRLRGPFSGDKWTRTHLTIPRALAQRWGLPPVGDGELPPAA